MKRRGGYLSDFGVAVLVGLVAIAVMAWLAVHDGFVQ